MKINYADLFESLKVMGIGMAGIFGVTIVIILAIYLLGKIDTKEN